MGCLLSAAVNRRFPLADKTQLEILSKGIDAWNQWRSENTGVVPDLSGAQLQEGCLRGADFSSENLTRAVLIGADLSQADLTMADLSQADLRFARLKGAKLKGASITTALGVDKKLFRSTMTRPVSKRRIAGMVAVPVLAIALAYAGLAGRPATDARPAEAFETPVSAAVDSDPFSNFIAAQALRQAAVSVVSSRGRSIRLELVSESVSQVGYLLALRGMCGSLERHQAVAAGVDAITIVNSAGDQGWVFEEPRLCAELNRSELAVMDATVLGHSRPL